jgi:Uma2 family endonuclease
MATLVAPPPLAAEGPRRKRWTRAECIALQSAGLVDFERYQLVEGDLIDTMGKNRPHVNAVVFILAWLQQVFGIPAVNQEAPIDVAPGDNPINEPEPDLIVLKPGIWSSLTGNPDASDLLLAVEVSDSSLAFDLTVKAALYARAGIVEYWVLDVNARRLIVHRQPENGRYQSVVSYDENEPVSPLAAPRAEFCASQAFPTPAQ